MYDSRRISSFAAVLLMLTAVSAAAVRPTGGGVRLLHPDEAVLIRGGGGLPSSGSSFSLSPTSGGGGSSPPPPITLNNVPYVTQFVKDPSTGKTEYRSYWYCGIASALMIRAKLSKGNSSAPPLYHKGAASNYSHVDNNLKTIDTNLQYGWYGSGGKKVYVTNFSRGLVYTGSASNGQDFAITTDILRGVYRGRLWGHEYDKDNISNDRGHVTDVSMEILGGYEDILVKKEISAATKAVWDHITTYNQPVVVLVDSNKQKPGGSIIRSSASPILHYIVIRGIKETSSGTRYFYAYDPGDPDYPLEYTEAELRYIMALSGTTNPRWVYDYGRDVADPLYRREPAYILKVQGD
ncbi:MAG: hypothetical protein LBC51_10970 [Treponema sp.]|nr:hypothetical protein [Treponema sp.]